MTFDPSQFVDAQGNPTDPKLVQFAQALRTTESGGDFAAKGKSGEHGAYQWMPGNYEAGAKQFGVDPTDMSPAAQNKVAYMQLAQMKASGLQPYEIAAKWNSGSADNWQNHSGTNDKGVAYDTPAYVKKVMDHFVAASGGQNQAATVAGPQLSAPQQADQTSAQNSGAWFPAASNDSPLAAGLKAAGNLIPSAFNFAKGALNALNPVNTMNTLGQIPGAFSSLVHESGGVGNALKAFGSELLPTTYNSLVPEAARQAIGGDLAGAARSVTNDPFGQVAPFVFGAKGAAEGIDAATAAASKARMSSYVDNIAENTAQGRPIPKNISTNFGGAVDAGISKIASPVTGAASYAFGKLPGVGAAGADAAAVKPGAPAQGAVDAAGKVLQGDVGDATLGARVLGQVDTTGVKTYEDLSTTLQKSIDADKVQVDDAYAASPKPVPLNSLEQKVSGEVGGVKVSAKVNYVKTALNHLQELYQKTNDVQNLANIRALIAKAKKQGLTPSEINGIARKYGTEFGDKAFSARSGDPLTSVNARAYENVRSGLKDTARNLLKDDKTKALDKGMSDKIKVKKLADQMKEKVNKLEQRVVKRNVVEKIARGMGQVIDFATFGGPKAFIQKLFFPSNVGLKTMNSIDLEAQLSKNLKAIRSFEKGDDTAFAGTIVNLLKATNQVPNTVFGRRPQQQQIAAPVQ